MANFAQRKVARESIEGTGTVVPDGLELPAESVEGILADLAQNEKEIDQHDAEADVLAEDATETEEQFDAVGEADDAAADPSDDKMEAEEDMSDEAAEALDVAQESIRRRWGFDHRASVARESYGARNRRQVARESLWDDIKAFFRRIWEWLKEQGRKVKDRWLKFSNQGKSIQNRSKKYAEIIRNLGKIKSGKDEISGGFIKSLTVGGKFIGDNVTELKAALGKSDDMNKAQADLLSDLVTFTDVIEKGVTDAKGHSGAAAGSAAFHEHSALVKDMKAFAGSEELLGNQIAKIEVSGEGEEVSVTATVVESERDVPSEVKTPSIGTLGTVNTFYGNLGKEIEKFVQAYHKNNQAREKYENGIEKILKRLDNLKVDDLDADVSKLVRISRRFITSSQSLLSTAERVVGTIAKNAVAGINSYIQAGIAAYDKK
ncbi:internal head protein [Erwinia phage vB_EamM_Caitlin]|uniref:internal head protein n=1 Tax=Erwinia phage vB_EamM_Caitlin TaxID=1883379 RepID=UPI00081CA1DB|nr:internal head protein [Erwinia phage vB_EamM_Caitlin]ANZ48359.1 hypothetical protein CAITLIN_64 [Erwinia phage vB_EamM_Caitlin]